MTYGFTRLDPSGEETLTDGTVVGFVAVEVKAPDFSGIYQIEVHFQPSIPVERLCSAFPR